jgi:hypothetical protein
VRAAERRETHKINLLKIMKILTVLEYGRHTDSCGVWIGLIWPISVLIAGCCRHSNELFGLIKRG